MIDIELFRAKLSSFPPNYMWHFDNFWKQKLKSESKRDHILDDAHVHETHSRLCYVLDKWQTYQSGYNANPCKTLKDSLRNICNAYNQIREYSLLDFSKIPQPPLELIWNELGRVKEYEGSKSDEYFIIAVCKPLMLLWGQTLAFDSHVRENIPSCYQVPKEKARWSYQTWIEIMTKFSEELNQNPEIIDAFKKESVNRYGTDSQVPFGRFFDIYYFRPA